MYFDASLLGESLDELIARLDARDALTDWANVLQPGSPRTTVAVAVSRSSSVTT